LQTSSGGPPAGTLLGTAHQSDEVVVPRFARGLPRQLGVEAYGPRPLKVLSIGADSPPKGDLPRERVGSACLGSRRRARLVPAWRRHGS
jgi:hypothetical protein